MKQNELREWLVEHQENCPGCGCRSSPWDHLHHVFVRRLKPIDKFTWAKENCSLVCASCHTGMGEAPDLNYNCAMQKFQMGFDPDDIRDWIDSLPTKIPLHLPEFFFRAQKDFDKT